MKTFRSAMVLTAGEGTRLRPFTLQTPKPAIPFLGVPMAAYLGPVLHSAGVEKLVLNTFHLPAQIRALGPFLRRWFTEVAFSEEAPLLGPGGGLKNAEQYFSQDEHLLLVNGDEVLPNLDIAGLQEGLKLHLQEDRLATIFVMNHPQVGTKFGGVWADRHNAVQGFGKLSPDASLKGWHYFGLCAFHHRIFDLIPAGQASNIFYDILIKNLQTVGSVKVHPLQTDHIETGNAEDLLAGMEWAFANRNSVKIGLQPLLQFLAEWGFHVGASGNFVAHQTRHSLIEKKLASGDFVIEDFAVFNEPLHLEKLAKAHFKKAVIHAGFVQPQEEAKVLSGLLL